MSAVPAGLPVTPTLKAKKKLVRRMSPDHSQFIRLGLQIAFLLLNVVIGTEFYRFVRSLEMGAGGAAARPAGVEGWLPIAGLMNFKYLLVTGRVPVIHPAAMFLLVAFLVISLVFRKAFCSWFCPVGTLSEYLWRLGQAVFGRNFRLPRWLDIGLRGLKYLLLSFFLYAVIIMPAAEIAAFMASPYGLIADVKLLNFFRYAGETAAMVLAALIVASLFVQNFWCRYLCPYGALMGLVSVASPLRIRRNTGACIDCAKCAKACPSALPVDILISIKSAECTACLECVAACPAEGALALSAPAKRAVPAWVMAAGIAVTFLGMVGYAKITGHWTSPVSTQTYEYLVPRADEAAHPLPGQ